MDNLESWTMQEREGGDVDSPEWMEAWKIIAKEMWNCLQEFFPIAHVQSWVSPNADFIWQLWSNEFKLWGITYLWSQGYLG